MCGGSFGKEGVVLFLIDGPSLRKTQSTKRQRSDRDG